MPADAIRGPKVGVRTQQGREHRAQVLYDHVLGLFDIPLDGSRILDFGCHWGYFGRLLIEKHGAASVDGFDVFPHWEHMTDGFDPLTVEGLRLHAAPHISQAAELSQASFDLAFSAGTLFLLEPTDAFETLSWIVSHLRPGGDCVLTIRSFLGKEGASLHKLLDLDRPQLLFPTRTLDRWMSERGQRPTPYRNPSCAATWLALLRRVGFEIVEVRRHREGLDEPTPEKLMIYDPEELETGLITCHLRRGPSTRDPAAERVAPGVVSRPAADRAEVWAELLRLWNPVVDAQVVVELGSGQLSSLDEQFTPRRLITAADLTSADALEAGSVDLIVCSSGLESMTPERVEANVERAYRLLRPGGQLLLRVAMTHRQAATDPYVNWLTPSTYLAIFVRSGFEDRKSVV
jgi:cyclopropane fatty-acyl-phospholipid synthase-like methyltransferase